MNLYGLLRIETRSQDTPSSMVIGFGWIWQCVCMCWYFIQVCGCQVDFVCLSHSILLTLGEGSEAELANLPRLVVSCRGLLSPLSRAEMKDTYPLLHHPHLLKWMPEI